MNAAQIDFQQLRIKHILYKSKVRSVLYGGVYDENFFSNSGPISTWMKQIGEEKYHTEPEIKEMARIHQELNSAAMQLFSLYKNGNIDKAHEGMSMIEKISDQFLTVLSKVEERMGGSL